MAAAEAATPLPASSPHPAPTPVEHSLSNVSSPLTEVEDKDGEPDDMDLDGPHQNASSLSKANAEDDDEGSRAAPSHTVTDAEDESALSEIDPDINDSEAETERLYDSPDKVKNIKDGGSRDISPEISPSKYLSQKRDRTFQASPSKLKQQIRADMEGDNADGDKKNKDGSLSDAVVDGEDEDNEADGEEEAVTDKNSRRRKSGTKDQGSKKPLRNQTPSPTHKTRDDADKEDTPVPPSTRSQRTSSDARKRKRSPTTDPSESDQPLRKRLGSNTTRDNDKTSSAETNGGPLSAKPKSNGDGAHADSTSGANDEAADQAEASAEGTGSDTQRIRRSRRGNAKNSRKDSEEAEGGDDTNNEEPHRETVEDADPATADEDGAGHAEDEQPDGEVDEEAELAHKNEEESTDTNDDDADDDTTTQRLRAQADKWNDANHNQLVAVERKKAAFEQMHMIEKHFASFRDKLYQERLDQLNEEEAMLLGDSPTHPEYLAMMKCVNDRHNEKIRLVDVEYEFNMATLKRWAVARRQQIHGQYFQAIRESRELVLEELGRQWYQIQQQRRKHANTIPDYGLRFPATKAHRVKNAITYNKEVSILSGIAKYEGFPAAPQIKGASAVQVDDDLDAISSARHVAAQQAQQAQQQAQMAAPQHHAQIQAPPPPSQAYAEPAVAAGGGSGVAGVLSGGAVSFNSLGAAGQQFLADTPWANPHHPSHHVQRHQQTQQEYLPSPAPVGGPSHGLPQQLPPQPPPPPQQQQQNQYPYQQQAQAPVTQAAVVSNSSTRKQQQPPQQPAAGRNGGTPSQVQSSPQPQRSLQHHHHHHHHSAHHHHHHTSRLGGGGAMDGKTANGGGPMVA